MFISGSKIFVLLGAVILFLVYTFTAPSNHSEAEDAYDFALKVEQGTFADQSGVNRVLALPVFGAAYKVAQFLGYSGRAFRFMIFINRILAVVCLYLFYRLLSYRRDPSCLDVTEESGVIALGYNPQLSTPNYQLTTTLLLAFSYGFWRYANEAETYILASVFVLGAWGLVLRPSSLVLSQKTEKGCRRPGNRKSEIGNQKLSRLSSVLCPLISALGIMIHLLNLIPLLLIIPLYYLLSKDWKKALLHGVLTGLLVLAGYVICSPWLDIGELGAQHHAAEGSLSLQNMLRGGIAFGQNFISANFLFGFESFRELLVSLFPSRMLDEEFYMASKMAAWIPWAGGVTLSLFVVCCLVLGIRRGMSGGAGEAPAVQESGVMPPTPNSKPLTITILLWLFLYAVAVIRTEAGSPELWIMALIPFWLLVAPFLQGGGRGKLSLPAVNCLLLAALFTHNLIAGFLPIMSKASDYHAQKGTWLVENTSKDDLILTSYEPILIFYLNYYSEAEVINSGAISEERFEDRLGTCIGNAYAFNNFFHPLGSMAVRSPEMYERMAETGAELFPMFGKVRSDEFGGIYRFREKSEF